MELKFITNDYVLAWNLLFQPSYTTELNNMKQKLWENYKIEYNNTYKDKELIFKDYKNFIPENDLIYNIIFEKKLFDKIKTNTEKYKKELVYTWDSNKTKINEILRKVLRKNIIPYDIFVVNKELNLLDASINDNEAGTRGNLVIGKDDNNYINTILNIILYALRKSIKTTPDKENITRSIIELAVLCELPTKLTKKSNYISGNPDLIDLKRRIYPYWLMYLGVKVDDIPAYMQRDRIAFSMDNYKYDKSLSRIDIEEFIDYIYNNIYKKNKL